MPHGSFFIARESLFIFLVTVQQENGIIHRNSQLKDCIQCLRNIGNFSQENIGSHIIEDCNTYT